MVRKYVFCFIFLFFLAYIGLSQDKKVNFIEIEDMKPTMKKAKKEKKPIFLDMFADWCGWCKVMDSKVFTNNKVADCFNDNFINVKVDFEKSLGRQLSIKYSIDGLPSYIILDWKGNLKSEIVGYNPVDKILKVCNENKNI